MSVHSARSKTPDNVAVIPPISPLYLAAIKSNQLPWQHFCDLVELQGMSAQHGVVIQLQEKLTMMQHPLTSRFNCPVTYAEK
jgi:hypothetical protein